MAHRDHKARRRARGPPPGPPGTISLPRGAGLNRPFTDGEAIAVRRVLASEGPRSLPPSYTTLFAGLYSIAEGSTQLAALNSREPGT